MAINIYAVCYAVCYTVMLIPLIALSICLSASHSRYADPSRSNQHFRLTFRMCEPHDAHTEVYLELCGGTCKKRNEIKSLFPSIQSTSISSPLPLAVTLSLFPVVQPYTKPLTYLPDIA
jgi:hypothetical protein